MLPCLGVALWAAVGWPHNMASFPTTSQYQPMGKSGVFSASIFGSGPSVRCKDSGVVILGADTVAGETVIGPRKNVQRQTVDALAFTATAKVFVMCARWNQQWQWAARMPDGTIVDLKSAPSMR